MYQVIKINEFSATRTVELKSEITGERDICFDDSALVSSNNFYFMEEGKSYDCYIKLFGDISDEGSQKAVKCKIVSNEVIGNREFLKVFVNKDVYYIPKNKVQGVTENHFWFTYTRKDLIKVDETIHDDLLRK